MAIAIHHEALRERYHQSDNAYMHMTKQMAII